jgi:hypothetical protein
MFTFKYNLIFVGRRQTAPHVVSRAQSAALLVAEEHERTMFCTVGSAPPDVLVLDDPATTSARLGWVTHGTWSDATA